LSVTEVFKDPNVVLLTITFSLSKSVIYGIMLWLPMYFKRLGLGKYSEFIPIAYDCAAIIGSVVLGYLFKRVENKGILMIPFMVVLFISFLILKMFNSDVSVVLYFIVISAVGFALGGIFNTLSGLVVMELTKVIPENLRTSSLGFYSALTMAVGNFTTALTQILIGFALDKSNHLLMTE
jgi:sugar phosphate permease